MGRQHLAVHSATGLHQLCSPVSDRFKGDKGMLLKGNLKITVFILICFLGFMFKTDAHGAPLEVQITAGDGAAQDYFGGAVAISGIYAVAGARGDDDNGADSGAVYIFKRDGTVWIQQVKLTPSDGDAGDRFGSCVAISGDYVIVGAPFDDDNGSDSGAAYIFKRDGTTWTQQAKLKAGNAAEDLLGTSVSICGEYALVGIPGDDDNGADAGTACIFRRNGTTWSVHARLTAGDGAAEDTFGAAVSITGTHAIVGTPGDDDNGSGSGSAYIFNLDGDSWREQQKIIAADGAADDAFGTAVSLFADHGIVGAPQNNDNGACSGSACIFKLNGGIWSEQQKLIAGDGAAEDRFGISVAMSENWVVVGARGDADNGFGSGSAYLFRQSGTVWSEQPKLTAGDGAANDRFGGCVSISGGDVIVGAMNADYYGQDSGSVYIYFPEGIFGGLTTAVTGTAGVPVAGATIAIRGTSFTTVSDFYGLYRFADAAPGEYTLEIAKPQFARKTVTGVIVATEQVTVVPDQELTLLTCDADSDSILGLEDAIHILQILSDLR